jgi:hypothetical protein
MTETEDSTYLPVEARNIIDALTQKFQKLLVAFNANETEKKGFQGAFRKINKERQNLARENTDLKFENLQLHKALQEIKQKV